jgi:hypothetical protein
MKYLKMLVEVEYSKIYVYIRMTPNDGLCASDTVNL